MYECIEFRVEGEIATLTLNRPASLNSLIGGMQRELRDALAQVRVRPEIRALILTGAGRAFCSGGSLDAMSSGNGGASVGERTAAVMREQSNPLILELRELPVPVVCAVNGAAASAGVGIALACDVVIAARSAVFVLTFVPRLGLVPDLGTSWHLPRLIGHARAAALTLLGDRLSAEQAAAWGMIWRCVDDASLMSEAGALATRLGRLPSHAVREVRAIFDHSVSARLPEQLEYEAARQCAMADSAAFAEGVRAFFERREPQFPVRGKDDDMSSDRNPREARLHYE